MFFWRFNVRKLLIILLISVFSLQAVAITAPDTTKKQISWSRIWDEAVFEKAQKENKLVILDLEAVWCHWCHVMHEETYTDPTVARIIEKHYIPIRIDHDLRPDLANKYREYGWPATIIFDSKGNELVKRAGYIPPDEFKVELQKLADNPVPERPSVYEAGIKYSEEPKLTPSLKQTLLTNHKDNYDSEVGGLNIYQKFIDRDSVEYSLIQARFGNASEAEMASQTLNVATKIIDPVWGGAYQYSTMGDWNYPHYEKLSFLQGEYLRIYTLGYVGLQNDIYLGVANAIYSYIKNFLKSPEGVFYTSQDADIIQGEHSSDYFKLDDKARREKGVPRVDKNIYTSQNSSIINGLIYLYNATNNVTYLNEAIEATNWLIENRGIKGGFTKTLKWIFADTSSPDIVLDKLKWAISNMAFHDFGFKHNVKDAAGPFLTDNIGMGQVFVSLYKTTKDKKWLVKAEQVARFLDKNFYTPVAGYSTAGKSCEVCAVGKPTRRIDENISIVRFASRLYKYTNDRTYIDIADHSMKYLATPEVATSTLTEPGILIADMELEQIKKT